MKIFLALCLTVLAVATFQAVAAHETQNDTDNAKVIRFELFDSKTDQKISNLHDGMVISLQSLGLKQPRFNIKAVLDDDDDSVRVTFDVNAIENYKTSRQEPHFMCGSFRGGPKKCWDLQIGTHVITATPFTISDRKPRRVVGVSFSIRFTIVESCTVPKFVTNGWEVRRKKHAYPIPVSEAQGSKIGKDLFLVGGFSEVWSNATPASFVFDTTEPNGWRRVSDIPIPDGLTHGAFVAIHNQLFVICGGYIGGTPGPEVNNCFVYNHSTTHWSELPSLPFGRAGGGIIYDSYRNALYFASGASRPTGEYDSTTDHDDTWMLSLNSTDRGWIPKSNIPFRGNHISFVSASDGTGNMRHFFVGGQKEDQEKYGNTKEHFEWDASSEVWIKRADMLFARGHAASSTFAYGCGYLVIGGTTNEYGKTSDISYYDASIDKWFYIGDLPARINTPVCAVVDDVVYCETGKINHKFSVQRIISM